ncbi:MAG: hypothetical protein ACK4TI_04770 [Nitrososphaerales archaeon]
MSFTEEEIRRAADMKVWIEARIAEHEADIERLKQMLLIIDSILKHSSFKSAAEIIPKPPTPTEAEIESFSEVRPIKRVKDGLLLGNIYISPNILVIIPSSDAKIMVDTPPFKSFFVNRILEGMKAKDNEAVKEGKMQPNQVLSYAIEDDKGRLTKITIQNYGNQTRLNEIISTITWSFTRMLEKTR